MSTNLAFSSRRSFLQKVSGVTVATAWGFQSCSAKAPPAAKVIDTRVISKTPDLYCGWPTLTRRANGQLLLVYSGGRERHVCPFGRVELMRSNDNGESWSWPRTLLDGPIDDRDAGVVETAQGSILVTTFTSLAYESRLQQELQKKAKGEPDAWSDEHIQRWQAVQKRTSEKQRQAELGQWMIRSTDGGVTWSARYSVMVDSPHGPIQLADGRLLYAGQKIWDANKELAVYQSLDDGQSWSWLADLPTRENDLQRNYHELHVAQTKDGQLVMHIRNHNPANKNETLQCESLDGGTTWSVPHPIGVWGLPSHLITLHDGRLLMSYGHRRPPYGNLARVSDNAGKTWSEPLTISNDGLVTDLGYPSTVQLDDGSLITVWYEKMFGSFRAVLRQARWTLDS